MYYGLYQLLAWFLLFTVLPVFLIISGLTGRYRTGLAQRLGFLKPPRFIKDAELRIWLHAASVGEIAAARVLIDEIRNRLPDATVIVSTMTEQGLLVARQQLSPDVMCIYAPVDLPLIVHRALRTVQPRIYICIETELWPNILREARRTGACLILLNGRVSERSFGRYIKIRGLMKEVLAQFSAISVIGQRDKERFAALGAEPEKIFISGNVKYDQVQASSVIDPAGPENSPAPKYRSMLNLDEDQPVFMAGSTHSGEEAELILVFKTLKSRMSRLIWVVAPRHLHRLSEIETLFADNEIGCQRLSRIINSGRREDVILVDSMGELAALYSVATFVFCGGSLVPRGGHNIMEPAAWGKPVFYGPSMNDFADAKELLESADAGFPVSRPSELTQSILYFLDRPDEYNAACKRALQLSLAQQGSAKKQVQLIINCLAAS